MLGVQKNLLNAQLFDELEKLKPIYFNETRPSKKQEHKKNIDEIILKLSNGHKDFDFQIYFSEVFHHKNGFDILIANPPYITIALGKKQKFFSDEMVKFFKETYKNVFEYKGNTYSLFFARSVSLLHKNSILTFITPNTLLLNSTFSKTREFILKHCNIDLLLNITDRVFEEAEIGGNAITILSRGDSRDNKVKFSEIDDLMVFSNTLDYDLIMQKTFLLRNEFKFYLNQTSDIIMQKLNHNSIPLEKVVKFYQGIITGDNKKYLSKKKINSKYCKILEVEI